MLSTSIKETSDMELKFNPMINKIVGNPYSTLILSKLEQLFLESNIVLVFLMPCPNNRQYSEGNSWTEILGCSKFEAATALAKVVNRHKTKGFYNSASDIFNGLPYCSYVDQFSGATYYQRDETHSFFTNQHSSLVEEPTNQESLLVEVETTLTNQHSSLVEKDSTLFDYSFTNNNSIFNNTKNIIGKKTEFFEPPNILPIIFNDIENNYLANNSAEKAVSIEKKTVKKSSKFVSWEYGHNGVQLSLHLISDKAFVALYDEWSKGRGNGQKVLRHNRSEQALKLEIKKLEEFYHLDKGVTFNYIKWGIESGWQSLNHRGADDCFRKEQKNIQFKVKEETLQPGPRRFAAF